MKKMLFISLIFTLLFIGLFIGNSYALNVPPPPINIDISNSSFEKIDSTSFRIRQLTAPDYPGTYWVDFLWNRDNLLFEPTSVGEETTPYGKYRVAIVDKSGKFYSDPIAAMNDIDTWCGTPSNENLCLLKILPGVYDIGTNYLSVPSFVDIEGSGEKSTKIVGSGNGPVVAARNMEIRFLTVENTGGGNNSSTAIAATPQVKLTSVTAIAIGGIVDNFGISSISSLMNPPLFIEMTNVTVLVIGGSESSVNYGVFNVGGLSPQPITMKNMKIEVLGGTKNYGVFTNSGGRIDSSEIEATTTIFNDSSANAEVTNTLLDGAIEGSVKCAGVYDENFTFFASTCP
jgi:hypothetical protein